MKLLQPVPFLQSGKPRLFMIVSELTIAGLLLVGLGSHFTGFYVQEAVADVQVELLTDQQIIEALKLRVKSSEFYELSMQEAEDMIIETGVNSKLETFKDLQNFNPDRSKEDMAKEGERYYQLQQARLNNE